MNVVVKIIALAAIIFIIVRLVGCFRRIRRKLREGKKWKSN